VHQPTTVPRPRILSVSEKKEDSAYTDLFPPASQQNTANHFFVLWDKSVSHFVGNMHSEKNIRENLKGAKLEDVLAM
jgi:hypothetical protein